MKTTRMLGFLLCGLLGAVACGDDDSGGGGSGVDAEKPAGDLSEGEAMDLCDAVNAAGPTKEQACTFGAVFQSADKASCEAAAKACVDEPSDDDCSNVQESLKDCTAKAGDIETCFTEQAAAAKKEIAAVSCDDAGNPPSGGDSGGEQAEPSAACKAVQEACPQLFQN